MTFMLARHDARTCSLFREACGDWRVISSGDDAGGKWITATRPTAEGALAYIASHPDATSDDHACVAGLRAMLGAAVVLCPGDMTQYAAALHKRIP